MALDQEKLLFVRKSDAAVAGLRQHLAGADAAPRDRGGFIEDPSTGVTSGRPTAFIANFFISLLTEPTSAWYASADLAADCRRMLEFVLRRQYRDGSLDLGLWRHAPCEAGFCIGAAAAGGHDLRALTQDFPGRTELADQLAAFLAKAVPITRQGPMYTPNHRWSAAVGPLAWVHHFFPDPENLRAIDRYLATGLDIDDEGLYFFELSMGGYNTVSNRGLLAAALLLNRADLLAAVRANLHGSLAFVNPAGDIDTSFSFRQERGAPGRPGLDAVCARIVSLATNDPVLAGLADHLFDRLRAQPAYYPDNFPDLYCYRHLPVLQGEDQVPRAATPTKVRRHFHTACVYRVREGDFAASVKGNPPVREPYNDQTDGWCGRSGAANLLSVWHGPAVLDAVMLKVCYQHFQAMKPRGLEVVGNECRLTWHFGGFPLLEAPFLDDPKARGYQWADLTMNAAITVATGAVTMTLEAQVPEGVETQAQVEFLFRTDGQLKVDGVARPLTERGVVWFDGQTAEYWRDGYGLRIASGGLEHRWFLGDFKIESGWAEAHCARLVTTGYTPFRRTFTITACR